MSLARIPNESSLKIAAKPYKILWVGGVADFQLNKIRRCANKDEKAMTSDWAADRLPPPGRGPQQTLQLQGLG